MKGTEKIIAHIEADARQQADAILADAQQNCDAIRARYEDEASRLYSEKIRDGVRLCQEQEDGALRISRMEARKSVLAVKQEMVDRSFDLAKEKLLALPPERTVAFLTDLIRKAGPAGDEEIIMNPADRAQLGEKLVKAVNASGMHMTLSSETRDISGGLVLRRGKIETNCSVDLLLDLCRSELSSAVAQLLFG